MKTNADLSPEIRKAIADQLRGARKNDAEGRYVTTRGIGLILTEFRGLENFLDYVKTLSPSKILDVGTGTGLGISGLAKSGMGTGLAFEATTLTRKILSQDLIKDNNIKIYQKSAETISRLPANSFGGVLALYSIAYSRYPEVVVKNIDRILVAGGAFKGTFGYGDDEIVVGAIKLRGINFFKNLFESYDYDVAELGFNILLALKPGANIKANGLLERDYQNYKDQIASYAP